MDNDFKKLILKSLKRAGIDKQVSASLVLEEFSSITSEIFGKKILEHARCISLKDGVLSVACLSSVVAQELKFKENEILKTLNRDDNLVKRIRYIL